MVLNLALFVPLGAALGLGGQSLGRVALGAALVTGGVELLQLTVVTGRDASAADLVANTIGGILGGWVAQRGGKLLFPGPRAATGIAAGWTLLGACSALLMAWSLSPSLRPTTWYGQWAPFGGEPEWFDGAILAVSLGRSSLPHWKLSDSEGRRAALERDTVRLAASIVSIDPPAERLRIVALADSAGRMITLSQKERDLRFTVRTRAADLYLHSPVFHRADALPERSGDTLMVSGSYWRGWALVQDQGNEMSTLDGWSLLVPAPVGSPLARLATVGWLVFLFAPIGFYGGQLKNSAWAVAPAIVLFNVPVLIAGIAGTPWPAPWEVAVGATAALGGRVLCAALEPGLPDSS